MTSKRRWLLGVALSLALHLVAVGAAVAVVLRVGAASHRRAAVTGVAAPATGRGWTRIRVLGLGAASRAGAHEEGGAPSTSGSDTTRTQGPEASRSSASRAGLRPRAPAVATTRSESAVSPQGLTSSSTIASGTPSADVGSESPVSSAALAAPGQHDPSAVAPGGAGASEAAVHPAGGSVTQSPALLAALQRRMRDAARECYPPAAAKFRLQGRVSLYFCLDDRGGSHAIRLEGTTGSPVLDAAARDCVLTHAAPLPGLLGCYTVPVEFGR